MYMPKPVGTNPNKPEHNPLFPPNLRGRKLRRYKYKRERDRFFFEDFGEDLRNYLKTEDPKYLFIAIYKNERILQGERRFLRSEIIHAEEFEKPEWKKSSTIDEPTKSSTIDEPTIVWESIDYWQDLILYGHIYYYRTEKGFSYRQDYLKEAQNLLKKIGSSLIPRPQLGVEEPTEDGFIHIFPMVKGQRPSLEYKSAQKFLERWNDVKQTFEKSKSKKRYSEDNDDQLIVTDAIAAIKLLGGELYEDEALLLDLTNIRTKTASYIRLTHEYNCRTCKRNSLSDKTILRLLSKAKSELES